MFALVVAVLVIQQRRQPLNVAVVRVVSLLGCHQVDSWYVSFFFTYPVNDHLLFILSEHVYCKVRILAFKPVNLQNRSRKINACKIKAIVCGVA